MPQNHFDNDPGLYVIWETLKGCKNKRVLSRVRPREI